MGLKIVGFQIKNRFANLPASDFPLASTFDPILELSFGLCGIEANPLSNNRSNPNLKQRSSDERSTHPKSFDASNYQDTPKIKRPDQAANCSMFWALVEDRYL
jgi:hypothetical protein